MTTPGGPVPAEEPFMPTLDYSVVVPAYNETGRLAGPVRGAAKYFRGRRRSFEIIVSDDGSRDGTAALVEQLRREIPELRLVPSPVNRGKGHAVRLGVRAAMGALVLVADADGATPIEEVATLEAALDERAELAIGSRALGGHVQRRWYRHVIGRGFHALVRIFGVRGIRDTQCGFKLFKSSAARDLFARARMNGFSFDVEILLLAQRRGYRVVEVPVDWTHQPGSRINLVTDSARMAFDLIRIRARLLTDRIESAVSQSSDPQRLPTVRI
jgi:dolichyl-phosphate beta-glucosyltransferase